MRFNDFHIVILFQNPCAIFENFQHHIHADAHIRREDTADVLRHLFDLFHFSVGKACGTDNDGAIFPAGHFK